MNNPLKAHLEYCFRLNRDKKRLLRWIIETENKLGSNGEIIYQPLDNQDKERWYRWIYSEC